MPKKGLGRGLDALFGDASEERGPVEVNVKEIRAGRFQARKSLSEDKLDELVQSIKEHGVVQPVLVRKVTGGYEIVAGERRWRAAAKAGLETVPAVVKDLSDRQAMEIGLVENLQREDLNPIEEAEAYRRLVDEFSLTQEEVAARVGKSRAQVTNTLRLLNLPDTVREGVLRGDIQMGHAKVLLGLESPQALEVAARRIVKDNLSVRETERLVRNIILAPEKKPERPRASADPLLVEVAEVLQMWLGTPVRLQHGAQKGRIEIEYYGSDDLQRLLDIIAPEGGLEALREAVRTRSRRVSSAN